MFLDIRTINPVAYGPSDIFFLDTNVILYLHHPPSTASDPGKAGMYSNFIAQLRRAGCSLRISSFNIQEAFHVVETIALKDFNKKNSPPDISRKDFRKRFRSSVSVTQASLWTQFKNNYSIEDAIANQAMLESFINRYTHHFYDPIDYLFTTNHPTCSIITSDRDFSSDPTLTVYSY